MPKKKDWETNFNAVEVTMLCYHLGGTPQIGKSTFVSYLVNRIVHKTEYDQILVFCEHTIKADGAHNGSYYCSVLDFDKEKCKDPGLAGNRAVLNTTYGVNRFLGQFTMNEIEKLMLNCKQNCIAFFDGFQTILPMQNQFGHMVVFASPSFEESQTHSVKSPEPARYMNLWTKDELNMYKQKCLDKQYPDLFGGEEPDDLYDFFGRCIGFAVSGDRDKIKKDLYGHCIPEHVQKYRTSYMEVMNVWKVNTSACLYKMIPNPNVVSGHERVWLTKTVEDVIKYEYALQNVYELYNKSRENAGASKVDQGISFERFLVQAWLLKTKLKIKIYTKYPEEKWAEKVDSSLRWEFKSNPWLITYGGYDYGVHMKILYRLSVGAPSVDFYFLQPIETNQGSPDAYRLYLIQMTVAKKHKVDLVEIKNYLLKINRRIEGNDEIREQIEMCRNSNDLEMLRDQNSWVEQDKGKEPKLPLHHTDVEIWFLYIQETINDKFDGKVMMWK